VREQIDREIKKEYVRERERESKERWRDRDSQSERVLEREIGKERGHATERERGTWSKEEKIKKDRKKERKEEEEKERKERGRECGWQAWGLLGGGGLA